MPARLRQPLCALFTLFSLNSGAGTLYVDLNTTNATPPYTNWATAASTIQKAVDAAGAGDTVLVNDGIYQTDGRIVFGGMSNRVAITKALTVQSVHGASATVIQGYQVPGGPYGDGEGAVRCAYLGDNAVLIGFTLTNGATRIIGALIQEQCGAGVWCAPSAVVSNCVLAGNSAWNYGGAAYQGTFNNCTFNTNLAYRAGAAIYCTLNSCLVVSNWAERLGGGVSDCTLNRCTLSGNRGWNGGGGWGSTFNDCILSGNFAGTGGGGDYSTFNNCTVTGNSASNLGSGTDGSTVNNSIVYYNAGENYSGCTINFSCTTPNPGGTGNTASEPLFANLAGGDLHLQPGSPCINTGNNTNAPAAYDLDGNRRIVQAVVDMGAYEFQQPIPFLVSIAANGTNAAPGAPLTFTAVFQGGLPTANVWDFGDATSVSNQLSAAHSWAAVGSYPVVLTAYNDSNPGGVSATVAVHVVQPVVHYVSLDSAAPSWPYTNWTAAATNLQDALDAASSGDEVIVTNGVYRGGGLLVPGTTTLSRAAVTKALNVQSVNGPAVTTIDGAGAVRCVYLSDGATLSGFKLTNGVTPDKGGGILCASTVSVVSNCALVDNSASVGSGVYQGTLTDCVLSGGGAAASILNRCILTNNDNAAYLSSLNNCMVAGSTGWQAVSYCQLTNCVLTGNVRQTSLHGILVNCVLTANVGTASTGDLLLNCTVVGNADGLYDSLAYNCIVYYNDAAGGANYVNDNELKPNGLSYCCTTPLPPPGVGVGNITNAPLLVDLAGGDLHLQPASPCINSGQNSFVGTPSDLQAAPRIAGGAVDIGAFEFPNPTSRISYAWLQQYALPMDGTADSVDADNDGMNTWQEWIAGTDPTNRLSVLKMLAPSNNLSGVTVSWQSVSGKSYYLQAGIDLMAPGLFSIQSNIVGQAGITSFTDTNAYRAGPYFYRVGVQ
jgi:hypothetical protein